MGANHGVMGVGWHGCFGQVVLPRSLSEIFNVTNPAINCGASLTDGGRVLMCSYKRGGGGRAIRAYSS